MIEHTMWKVKSQIHGNAVDPNMVRPIDIRGNGTGGFQTRPFLDTAEANTQPYL